VLNPHPIPVWGGEVSGQQKTRPGRRVLRSRCRRRRSVDEQVD